MLSLTMNATLGVSANALQRLGKPSELVLGRVLHPQLERRRDARLERGLQPVSECSPDFLRADQVELARTSLARSKVFGEHSSDLVQDQAGTFSVEAS